MSISNTTRRYPSSESHEVDVLISYLFYHLCYSPLRTFIFLFRFWRSRIPTPWFIHVCILVMVILSTYFYMWPPYINLWIFYP
ncbi:hypothetical protein MtrunA17_Chr8g0369151 [Medicago truncatula]|uniref:Transmembrane protein n=1 Tax=Medicago truncatula TaxID=3880 RepID=A0A396GKR9_MEDTR|nr:hypothetical protein MtrunA17_Chr8g0369151 [Medicago truncatula]